MKRLNRIYLILMTILMLMIVLDILLVILGLLKHIEIEIIVVVGSATVVMATILYGIWKWELDNFEKENKYKIIFEHLKERKKDMREIKFRAWHKKHKQYYGVSEIYFWNNRLALIGVNEEIHKGEEIEFSQNFDDVILEQYTGLKDIDGKEIYEGDIVKGYLIEDDKVETIIGTINRISGYIVDIKDTNMFMWVVDMEKLEIIGNIHENGDFFYISVSMSKKGVEKISIMPYEEKVKQEKLLELYRKYFNVAEHWYETNNSGNIRKETAIEIEKLEGGIENE